MTDKAYTYLDHNILDYAIKNPGVIEHFFEEKAFLTPVFSAETLKEIKRSKGFEDKFLAILTALNAVHLVPEMQNNRFSDKAYFHTCNPFEVYKNYLESQIDLHGLEAAFPPLLQSFYGHEQNQPPAELLHELPKYGVALLSDAMKMLRDSYHELPEEYRDQFDLLLRYGDEAVSSGLSAPDLDEVLSDITIPTPEEIDAQLAEGPAVLNNLQKPDIVQQIWRLLPDAIASHLTIGQFFGTEANILPAPISKAECAQRVFSMLNYVGYYRDQSLSKQRKMIASLSDMGHIAYASYCHVTLSRDERFVKKATAAFEFIDHPATVLHVVISDRNSSAPTEPVS